MTKGIFFFCLVALFYSSCSNESRSLTSEEVKDFARKIEISLSKKEPAFFDNALDKKKLLKKSGIPANKISGKSLNLGTSIVNGFSSKTTFVLIKQYEKDGTWHLLYRIYDSDSQGLSYLDFELTCVRDEIKIADGYAYNVGQNLSELLKDLNLQMDEVADNAKENKDKWLDLVSPMRKLATQGKYQEALKIFQTIPPDVRKIKLMQIIHVIISSGIDAETYRSALEEYNLLYPNEPNSLLLQLSGYFVLEDYKQALEAINALDKMINIDPLLDFHRSICYKMLKDTDQQKKCLLRLNRNIPDFEDGILELIAVYRKEKNEVEADKWIKEFRLHSAYDQNRLDAVLGSYRRE